MSAKQRFNNRISTNRRIRKMKHPALDPKWDTLERAERDKRMFIWTQYIYRLR
jgi:hypothetical protein